MALQNKIVIVAALNGDFRMEPFPAVSRLISKADKIKLMKAYCFNCHKDAKYSLRIVQSNETVLIGAGEAYKPACRTCHKYFSQQREKGNLNILNVNKDNLENKENKREKNSKLIEEKYFSNDEILSTLNPKSQII